MGDHLSRKIQDISGKQIGVFSALENFPRVVVEITFDSARRFKDSFQTVRPVACGNESVQVKRDVVDEDIAIFVTVSSGFGALAVETESWMMKPLSVQKRVIGVTLD